MPYPGVIGSRTLEPHVQGKSTGGELAIQLLAAAKLGCERPAQRGRVSLGRHVGKRTRARGICGREGGRCQRIGLRRAARGHHMFIFLSKQLELEVVSGAKRRLQLRAQLGIGALQADSVGLRQRLLDRRQRSIGSSQLPQHSCELEVCFELLHDAAKGVQLRPSGRETRERLIGAAHGAKHDRALQQRLCPNERTGLAARRDHFIEQRFPLRGAPGDGGVEGLLDPDARDSRGRNRKTEGLPIVREGLLHPALFGIDGRERTQARHAPPAIERHRTNRERALEELPRALPVAERVVVDADSIEAIRLISWRLHFLRECECAVIEPQRFVQVAECIICQRRVGDHYQVQARVGLRTDVSQCLLEPRQRFRQLAEPPQA
jgi:hypothetical protein